MARKRKTRAERAFEVLANEPRKFRRIGGFQDDTEYVAIYPGGRSSLILIDGTVTRPGQTYTLGMCLKYVNQRVWEEVEN